MFEQQGFGCAICSKTEPKATSLGRVYLHVDHSHATGKVRGILCDDCNHGLGKFHDKPDLLVRAIKYLGT